MIPLEVDIRSVHQMLETDQEFLLIDCREQEEHDLCRIAGGRLIPMRQTLKRLDELATYQDKPIVVY